MFLVLFAHGYAPKDKERFYASSMIIALVIAGAHEAGRASKK